MRTNLVTTGQSEALLREIELQANEESRTLLQAADREAQAIVAQSYRGAGRRMKEAIAELRREGAHRLARAKAQAETEARQRAQRRIAEAIKRTWPWLVEALVARWSDSNARRAWITTAGQHARNNICGDAWIVEHPVDWNTDEGQYLRDVLGTENEAVKYTSISDLDAGIRIRSGQATLDASIQGLLADRPMIEALLLAEIASHGRN